MNLLKRRIQERIYKIIPIAAVCIILVLFFIGAYFIKAEAPMKINMDYPQSIDFGWVYKDTGKLISSKAISIYPNEKTTIIRDFPIYINDQYYLAFWNFYTQFEVYVDDRLIDKGGSEDYPRFGEEVGGLWYFIPVPQGVHRNISLVLKSTNKKQRFGLNTIFFGTKNQIGTYIFKNNASCLLICLLLLVYVILLLLYLGVMKVYKLEDYTKLILALCGLTVVSIFYIFNESNLYQFLIRNPSVRFIGSYFAVFLIPVFGAIFFREFFSTKRDFYIYYQNIYCSVLIITLLLYSLNILHVLDSIIIVYIAVGVITYAIVRYGFQDYKKTKDKLNLWVILAVLILIFGTIVSVSLYYLGLTTNNIIPYSYTYAIFISILFVTVMRRTFDEFSMATSADYYQKLAYTDKITGGNSRVYFEEFLLNHNPENSYFVLINLVHFKLINQIIGRKNSDDLLKAVYTEIEKLLSDNETVSSLGNARFCVCKNLNEEKELINLGNEIKEKVLCYTNEKNYSVKLNFEYAVCKINNDNRSLDQLIDMALMSVNSKKAKFIPEINCFVYNEECSNELLKEKMLGDYLETALENKEFHVFLQPKISLKNGRIFAAEALVRWINPKRGMIPPDEFIPSFEKDGKIEKVDLYTFKQVCLQIKKWISEGFEPPVISVNISKVAITFEGYFNRYLEIIQEAGIPGKYLEFELTESIAYNNIEMLREIIQKIHDIGSTCSMDDFGKSYSNIGVLGILPFDTAKMDKCFFDDGFPNKEKRVQLVKGTVGLLKNLNLEIVAEGIEEKEQVEALEEIGCDAIQGYYFAKPMDINSFEEYVKGKN